MAENIRKVDPTLLTSLLECSVCLSPYNLPVGLPCLHTFCRGCLETHISTTKDVKGYFRCPCCRDKCSVPKSSVTWFPKNFVVNTLKEAVSDAALQDVHSEAVIPRQGKTVPQCDQHFDRKVDLFCKTCDVAVCSHCLVDHHKAHNFEKLSVVAGKRKEGLLDISKLAAKRIASLQDISGLIESRKIEMNEDLDHVLQDIVEAEERVFELIGTHVTKLQDRMKRIRHAANEYIGEAQEEVKKAEENASNVQNNADSLYEEADQFPFRTAVQAPGIKEQFLQQQQVPVPSIKWSINKENYQPGPPTAPGNIAGDVRMKVCDHGLESQVETEKYSLGTPLHTAKVPDSSGVAISGIGHIYNDLLCVTDIDKRSVSVFAGEGQLKEKIIISDSLNRICGMVVLDGNQGKLAIIDETYKLHLVMISRDLKVIRHTSRKLPVQPTRMTMNSKGELCVSDLSTKCAVLTADGILLHTITLDIPGTVCIEFIANTPSGYIAFDTLSETIFFTDTNGVVKTSYICGCHYHAAHTSWGHVLVADQANDEITVFTEAGEFLASMNDSDGKIENPHYIHLDEAEKLLYVGCGYMCDEVRIYKFSPSDLPPVPLRLTGRKLEVTVKLSTP